MRLAKDTTDDRRPFDNGMELFLWTSLVAVLICGIGARLSFCESFKHCLSPKPIANLAVELLPMGWKSRN
jgi:hypothetical protein